VTYLRPRPTDTRTTHSSSLDEIIVLQMKQVHLLGASASGSYNSPLGSIVRAIRVPVRFMERVR
jgi:hypothetical protein